MVRPIDMQDNLSKTQGAERVNQIQKAAPEVEQRHAAQVVQEQQTQKQREAQEPERTDEALIHRDREKEQSPDKEKKKKKEKKKQRGLDITA